MARISFIIVCILLVGVWIHPYVTGAFEIPRGDTNAVARVDDAVPSDAELAQVNVNASELVTMRGREGFWRIGRTQDGVYWFVSPTGQREFLNTVTTVQPFQLGRDANGVHYVSRDYNGTAGKYDGDLNAWANATLARVHEAGFKGLGAWCHPVFHTLDVPITRDLNVWKHHGPKDYMLYSPDWMKVADEVIARAVTPLKDNKNLVGYYTDNELDWSDASIGPAVYFDGLASDNPNRVEVIRTIQTLWPSVMEYNAAWNASIKDWSELNAQSKLSREASDAYAKLLSVWIEKAATRYFKAMHDMIRKHDPNHLILGVRYAGFAPAEVVRASRGYVDAQSINYYVSDAMLDPDLFKRMFEEADAPLILTEYGFHALDGRSGNRNTFGFQAQVPDQQARADAYEAFTTRLARLPYFIGADWFQWSDEPPSGRSSDGEDVNFGVVDVDDRIYKTLAESVRVTTPKLNPLHALSSTDTGRDIFRNTFANKPVAHLPHLDRPIVLNGELSDWPENFRLSALRRSATVGIDRSEVRSPNVYMAWREDGLYIAAEVFDQYIDSVEPTGRWWTRDNIEFWVSTRPVATEQMAYNPFCHQFFFVPSARPTDGRGSSVNQWHRPGDAISQHLIPHPLIRHSSRVLPGRYVVEIFVPGKSLNGWDPENYPQMSFNMHIRNFHTSVDYFWSAPKETYTQMRPNTWGTIVLERPQIAASTLINK